MNDGVGTMSRALAQAIWANLRPDGNGSDIPSAFQGRIGSAKGVWIIHPLDDSVDDIWIKLHSSQTKFKCAFEDVHHRTFEVVGWSRKPSSAYLNQQFIPILEARSTDIEAMRAAMSKHLIKSITDEVEQGTGTLEDPLGHLLLMQKHGSFKSADKESSGSVPFIGGLPNSPSDVITTLLASGFLPKMKLTADFIWNMAKERLEGLLNKQKIEVPRSTMALMVADFAHVLQEGEVHFSFSDKFTVDGFSDTLLEGMDILVARTPAHLPTDIQKVRVVSKPELRKLKDVIIFPTVGNRPLADLLSGGDYDGDKAWVCWDQDIVSNFENARGEPADYDFVARGFMSKETTTFQQLLDRHRRNAEAAAVQFREIALSFSLRPSLLGTCTHYKDHLCYQECSVDSEAAVILSCLLSKLVDQAKAGETLTQADWQRLCKDVLHKPSLMPQPAYKKAAHAPDTMDMHSEADLHILDYLKFYVASGPIHGALKTYSDALGRDERSQREGGNNYDSDLTSVVNDIEGRLGVDSEVNRALQASLRSDLDALHETWVSQKGKLSGPTYQRHVKSLYERWMDISPPAELQDHPVLVGFNELWSRYQTIEGLKSAREAGGDWAAELSPFTLFKASLTFQRFCRRPYGYDFAWAMAGRQLCFIKCTVFSRGGAGEAPMHAVARVWAAMKPDGKYIAGQLARAEEDEFDGLGDEEDYHVAYAEYDEEEEDE